jgi:hypothetical protein
MHAPRCHLAAPIAVAFGARDSGASGIIYLLDASGSKESDKLRGRPASIADIMERIYKG